MLELILACIASMYGILFAQKYSLYDIDLLLDQEMFELFKLLHQSHEQSFSHSHITIVSLI